MTRIFSALALAAALAGCGSDARYATITPEPEARIPSLYGTIEVVEVTLPTYAEGEEIYAQDPDGAIVAFGPLWADLPSRAMTLQLASTLDQITGATVAAEPWPFRDFPAAKVDVRVEDMLATSRGTFRLAGQYYVAPEELGRNRSGRFAIEVPLPEDAGAPQIAAARGQATSQLAEQIARSGLR
ncbi:PqiC family protein [Litorisediminicola beolgyonensis]|uniref:Membrane integrity-associated transporter subunit PqiC n=1 Tax=Litorisediminicola beolgyonensis TaxID=1173614 RepID=A0ABW3ZG40_9RHOB